MAFSTEKRIAPSGVNTRDEQVSGTDDFIDHAALATTTMATTTAMTATTAMTTTMTAAVPSAMMTTAVTTIKQDAAAQRQRCCNQGDREQSLDTHGYLL